jgi:hypothetical protein
MRRLMVVLPLLALVTLAPASCRRKRKTPVAGADDGQLVTVLNVADPRAGVQLTRGFYGVEADSWRWTAKNFAVTLRTPTGAAQKGANLELKITVPEAIFAKTGPMTLSAKVNGMPLAAETFSKSGDFTYARDVPASALPGDIATVEFSGDKSIPPGDTDVRELAFIVTTVGLLPR